MTTPVSPDPISLDNVQTEFGGSNPIEIAEYYAGGSYVPATISGIPASGEISLQNFYNKTKIIYAISVTITPNTGSGNLSASISTTNNLPTNGYINITIVYPNSTSVEILTNQSVNSNYNIGITGSTAGYGTGSIIAKGYSSTGTLLATGSANYTITALPTYAFSSQPTSISEGGSGTFNITTANVSNGTTLYWAITNSTTSDADFSSTSGSFTINSNSGSFTIYPTADITTEGSETFSVTVRTNGIGGTVVLTSNTITISDTSVATYSLLSNYYGVNEGGNFTITFATNQSGSFPYTIGGTGITSADIGGAALTGSISNGSQLTYYVTADSTTEGDEIFTLSLNNGLASVNVTINDTSLTPPTYSFTRSVASVNEGGSFYIDFNTNQAGNYAYTITGVTSADLSGAALTGNISNGSRLNYTAAADNTTEGTEIFTITLNNGQATTSVTINDTSITPSYSLTSNKSTVLEGSNFIITFATNQAGSFPYTITGVTSASINSASLTGSLSNGNTRTFTVTADNLTEGNQTFTIALDNGQASVSVLVYDNSVTPPTINSLTVNTANDYPSANRVFSWTTTGADYVTIRIYTPSYGGVTTINNQSVNGSYTYAGDASRATGTWHFNLEATKNSSVEGVGSSSSANVDFTISPTPIYSFTRSASAVNEGGSFYIDFSTNQAGNFAYYINGVTSADISGASLTGAVTNGSRLSYTVAADNTTEGTETFNITLDNGQATTSVTIYDTSVTPTYSFSRSAAAVNEGDSFYIDFSTNQAGSFAYTIYSVSSADINGASLTGYVSNGSRLSYYVTPDSTTEGNENFNIVLDNGQASTVVTIYDTSLTPATYTFTRSTSAVNEGDSFYIDFSTNQAGNFAYYINGVTSADINGASLTGAVTNGSRLSYYVTPDSTTEGTETFNITLDNGQATTSVTIYDTSTTPIVQPVINSFGNTRTNVYPDGTVTISWSTTNAAYVILYIYNPSGQAVVGQYVDVNGSYVLAGDASRQLGTWQCTLYAYNSGFTAVATSGTAFTVIARPAGPDFSYAFAQPTSAENTSNVVISWNATNAYYVILYILNPAGSYSVAQYVDIGASSYTFTGSSTRDIGTYNVYLYAYNSDYSAYASRQFSFTLTAPAAASFTATLTAFYGFPDQRSGPNVYFDESNSRISVYARNNHSISYYGIAYYTLSAPGYIYCFLDVGSEVGYDFGYFYVDGTPVNTTPSYLHTTNGSGGYSGGYGTYDTDGAGGAQVFNNIKIGPLAAGSHYILILYSKDSSVSRNGDYISGAWTWSPN